MASEIRANSITSRAGLSTVTMTDSGPMFSGITTFVDNSGFTFGVGGGTSIFTPATNILTLGTNNTEKVRIDANGNTNITGVTTAANFKTGVSNLHDVGLTLSGGQIDVGSNIKIGTAGVVTATSFVGDGSNLTGISAGTSLSGSTNNTVCTVTGANAIQGEANLVFNGTKLGINQSSPYSELDITSSVEDANNGTLGAHGIRLGAVGATDEQVIPITAGFKSQQDRVRAGIGFISKISGSSEGYAGAIGFYTRSSADGNGLYRTDERLRIDSSGRLLLGTTTEGVSTGDKFTIATSGNTGMTIRSGSSNEGNIFFSDATSGTGEYAGSIQYNHGSNFLTIGTNGSERLRILSNGGIGVNHSNPRGQFVINSTKNALVNANCNDPHHFHLSLKNEDENNTAIGLCFSHDSTIDRVGAAIIHQRSGNGSVGDMRFYTCASEGTTSERLRIESDGQLVVIGSGTQYSGWAGGTPLNVNTIAMVNVGGSNTNNWGWGLRGNSGDTQWCLERIKDNSSFNDSYIKFRVYNNGNYLFAGGNQSDRDLKENILDITGTSLDKIKQLRPRTFNFIESEGYSTETKTGFIAQEVASIIPSITNGTDGNKDMAVDYNGLVTHLVKAVQEAITKIETLEQDNIALRARVTNLEGN